MGFGTNAANAIGDHGHIFHRTAHAESFEAAQFGNLEIGVGNIAFVVQEDFDFAVTVEAGDGIDCDALCHLRLLFLVRAFRLPQRERGFQ